MGCGTSKNRYIRTARIPFSIRESKFEKNKTDFERFKEKYKNSFGKDYDNFLKNPKITDKDITDLFEKYKENKFKENKTIITLRPMPLISEKSLSIIEEQFLKKIKLSEIFAIIVGKLKLNVDKKFLDEFQKKILPYFEDSTKTKEGRTPKHSFIDSKPIEMSKEFTKLKSLNDILEENQKIETKVVEIVPKKEEEEKMIRIKYEFNLSKICEILCLGINYNLKFYKKIRPKIFTLIINEELLEKAKLIKDLFELITECPSISAVNYILYPKDENGKLAEYFGFDCELYQRFYTLINAVQKNRKISTFCLHCITNYDVILPPEICLLISQKLTNESLTILHIGNFLFPDEFQERLEFLLSTSRTLLIYSIEHPLLTKENLESYITLFGKNKSLNAVSLVSPQFDEMSNGEIYQYKELIRKSNSKLGIINIGFTSIINECFFEELNDVN